MPALVQIMVSYGACNKRQVISWAGYINSSPPGQNVRRFADDIFMNEKFCILIKISLKFVP